MSANASPCATERAAAIVKAMTLGPNYEMRKVRPLLAEVATEFEALADLARTYANDAFFAAEWAARHAARAAGFGRGTEHAIGAKAAALARRLADDADQAADQAEEAAERGDAATAETYADLARSLRAAARDAKHDADCEADQAEFAVAQ